MVQWYKSQILIDGTRVPVHENGANLAWDENIQAPAVAGNFVHLNFVNGVQMPSMDVQPVIYDISGSFLRAANLNALFMTRTDDYAHDVAGFSAAFFDAFSGWDGLFCKANAFSISASKQAGFKFSASFLVYVPAGEGAPTSIVSPPDTYAPFTGEPVHFQQLQWYKNGSPIDDVNSFDLTYSNNCTPDLSMLGSPGGAGQPVYPIDVNAGMATGSARVLFQADAVSHIAAGDNFELRVVGGAFQTNFLLNNIVPRNPKTRAVGSGRQMRPYDIDLLGINNTSAGSVLRIS